LFSGDSFSEIQCGLKGELILVSCGTVWVSNFVVRVLGALDDVVCMDVMVICDIDFFWLNYVFVDCVVFIYL